ncbi:MULTISPECIES: 50S ribosomal protein L37ae [Methanoculleus]|jgi:large subunit ribosomal protein L37Ae|uniref:Large ribosomal subunit protein eL43 n=1 Tax=Methanoculleus thermophilus TaxID=2200 RepID=A0A1G9AMS7_9EURY|nr:MULTISPECIES: 50S ribosomal protein L37ae [Methanoculleus]NLN09597.1 50S ribosomal protein L37ae [Methanoculleus thermophilus]SDK27880.1 LSU ribosomal protein L37AE [Methanoculleus thermophilus]HQD26624.1 50S ribosomal protein L37ae [Methanoculleus thermophilus]
MANRKQSAKGRVVGSSGRFGPRYGRFIRKRVTQIEQISNARHVCPRCDRETVQREGTGIWLCRKCGFKFAGGSYAPETPAMRVAARSIERSLQKEG